VKGDQNVPSFHNNTDRTIPFVIGKNDDGSPNVVEVKPDQTIDIPAEVVKANPGHFKGLKHAGAITQAGERSGDEEEGDRPRRGRPRK
jgi:hypothetical protein